jgi:hypothetical protein
LSSITLAELALGFLHYGKGMVDERLLRFQHSKRVEKGKLNVADNYLRSCAG